MRTLSSVVQSVIAEGKTAHVCHLLTFTVGETTYRFAEDRVVHVGNLYLPHLALESPVRYSHRLQVEPVRVKLQNITLAAAGTMQAEQSAMQGAEATLERLFLKASESVILLVGQISEMEVQERQATLTLVGDLDPTATQLPRRS